MKAAGHRLWRDISLAVAFKIVLLAMLYMTLFSPSHRLPADTGAHLFNEARDTNSGGPIGQR
jgi:hypothetical protein